MNVCFETFGCRLNRAEALEDEAKAIAQGYRVVTKHSEADVFVVRGCSVTGRAQRECEKLIAHLRKHYPNKRLIMTGCLGEAVKRYTLPGTPAAVEKPAAAVPTRTARAYLKVQDGCAGGCSFCIVPRFRGKPVSEPFAEVRDKALRFIEAGYHEIVVTGCNLTLYSSEGRHLPELVDELARMDPGCRVRIGSVEPGPCASELVEVLAANENICRYLHLPVQTFSDRLLAAMKRPYKAEAVEELVKKARALLPNIGLGCDLMTGFPGETDGDYTVTKNELMRLMFTKAHVFPFSARPGTAAATMPGQVAHAIRSERAHRMARAAKGVAERFAKRFIGKQVEVIVESDNEMSGWTSEYLWMKGFGHAANFRKAKSRRKQRVKFIVRSVEKDGLRGLPVENGR